MCGPCCRTWYIWLGVFSTRWAHPSFDSDSCFATRHNLSNVLEKYVMLNGAVLLVNSCYVVWLSRCTRLRQPKAWFGNGLVPLFPLFAHLCSPPRTPTSMTSTTHGTQCSMFFAKFMSAQPWSHTLLKPCWGEPRSPIASHSTCCVTRLNFIIVQC